MEPSSVLIGGASLSHLPSPVRELNPGFDGKVAGYDGKGTPKIENGVVTELSFLADNVTDISPVRALSTARLIVTGIVAVSVRSTPRIAILSAFGVCDFFPQDAAIIASSAAIGIRCEVSLRFVLAFILTSSLPSSDSLFRLTHLLFGRTTLSAPRGIAQSFTSHTGSPTRMRPGARTAANNPT